MINQRNYSIDILKTICAILIVLVHTHCIYYDFINPITRCAVPCFFMISGYLLYNENGIDPKRLKRNLIHILKINIWATFLFAIFKEAVSLRDENVYIPTFKDIFKFLLFNENPFGYHLWYLSAYLYVLIVIYFINKYKIWKLLFYTIPFLLISDCMFGKYSILIFNQEFPIRYVRNFLCVGIPYFALGALIKRIVFISTSRKILYLLGIFIFSLTSLVEKYFLVSIDKNALREHYVSSTFLSICLFLFVLSYKSSKASWISNMGEKDSLYIYLFHPIFIWILPGIIKRCDSAIIDNIYNWGAPIVVLGLTIIFIYSLRKLHLLK